MNPYISIFPKYICKITIEEPSDEDFKDRLSSNKKDFYEFVGHKYCNRTFIVTKERNLKEPLILHRNIFPHFRGEFDVRGYNSFSNFLYLKVTNPNSREEILKQPLVFNFGENGKVKSISNIDKLEEIIRKNRENEIKRNIRNIRERIRLEAA